MMVTQKIKMVVLLHVLFNLILPVNQVQLMLWVVLASTQDKFRFLKSILIKLKVKIR